MPDDDEQRRGPRGFWSGTIAFGLVSLPVSLFVANRPGRVSLRMVDEDGTPLNRRYFCSREERMLRGDEIIRGYEVEKDKYVVVEDDELEALAPEKSREIDLQRFVAVSDIDPAYFERAYFLVPGGGGANPESVLRFVLASSGSDILSFSTCNRSMTSWKAAPSRSCTSARKRWISPAAAA